MQKLIGIVGNEPRKNPFPFCVDVDKGVDLGVLIKVVWWALAEARSRDAPSHRNHNRDTCSTSHQYQGPVRPYALLSAILVFFIGKVTQHFTFKVSALATPVSKPPER